MKHKGLIITIIICLLVFFSTLTAGIVLTIRTIGWSDLMDSSQLQQRITSLIDNFQLPDFFHGNRRSFTVDELKSIDLAGIKTIKISSMSEAITITEGGSQIQARLRGEYRSFEPLVWNVVKSDDTLRIYVDYPVLGLSRNDLDIQVQIPVAYTGAVEASSMSGRCHVPQLAESVWSSLKMSSLSGDLKIEQVKTKIIDCNSMSGDVTILECSAQVICSTISGGIDIKWASFAESTINSTSGNIMLQLPAAASCKITFTTVSGKFKNQSLPIIFTEEADRRTSGSMNQGDVPLVVHTVSGDLRLAAAGS